jgi:hypothetical protein
LIQIESRPEVAGRDAQLETTMPISRRALASAALAATASFLTVANAQAQTVKVGIVGPFSGPFAHYGTLFKAGAEAYVAWAPPCSRCCITRRLPSIRTTGYSWWASC